ncbi:MAG: cupin domain-containing protein [Desulfobacteraceae bacterium]|nr:cupin domain-containing protein [Desulfobacteraceae bacterium]
MFGKKSDNGYKEVVDGIRIKTISYGEETLMAEFMLRKGSVLPEHTHINEQTGYLLKGKIRLYINDSSRIMNPGDSWNVPSNAKHTAEIIEDSIAIEVFTPSRDDYLKYIHKKDIIE